MMKTVRKREEWEALIESWKQIGKTQSVFCREHGIKHSTFGYWKKRLSPGNHLFVPVKVSGGKQAGAVFYKIETVLGLNIIIPSGADLHDLKVIFKSLGLVS